MTYEEIECRFRWAAAARRYAASLYDDSAEWNLHAQRCYYAAIRLADDLYNLASRAYGGYAKTWKEG